DLLLGLLRVRTEDGVEGNCFFGPGSRVAMEHMAAQILGPLRKEVVGASVDQREALWSHLRFLTPWWGKIGYEAWAAVDVALWDLAGKYAGLPIYRLLGSHKQTLKGYVSSPYYPDVRQYVDEAVAQKE